MNAVIVLVAIVAVIVIVGVVSTRRGNARLGPAIDELALVVDTTSRGPDHFAASTTRGPTTVRIEIRPVMQFVAEEGREYATDPQTAFSAMGVDPTAIALLRPPGGHVTRRELPRGVRVPTGDAAFDQRFELLATDAQQAHKLCGPALRSALARLPRLAEVRWEDGQVSIRLSGTHQDTETLRAGIDATVLAVTPTG